MSNAPSAPEQASPSAALEPANSEGGIKLPDGIEELAHALPSSIPPGVFEAAPAAAPKPPPARRPPPPPPARRPPPPLPAPSLVVPTPGPTSLGAVVTLIREERSDRLDAQSAASDQRSREATDRDIAPDVELTLPTTRTWPRVVSALAIGAAMLTTILVLRGSPVHRPSQPEAAGSPAIAAPQPIVPQPEPVSTSTEAPAVTATAVASAPPPDTGTLKTSAASVGKRIFVDGRTVGETPAAVTVKCGAHSVRIGSAGAPQNVVVPCGGDLSVSDR